MRIVTVLNQKGGVGNHGLTTAHERRRSSVRKCTELSSGENVSTETSAISGRGGKTT